MSRSKKWLATRLGKALPIRYGKARTEKAGVVREDSPVYGSSGLIDKFDRALTTGPALIIGRKGTVGATHYVTEPCWPIDTVYFAEASEGNNLRFFKHLLDHLQLGRMDRSTAVPSLSRDDYNAKEVAIPDIDEQERIVAEIEKQFTRLEAGGTALRRVQANLKRYRAAVLKAACEGRLVPTEAELAKVENRKFETGEELLVRILREPRAAYAATKVGRVFSQRDFASLDKLPAGWAWAAMRQVGEVQLGRQRAPQHHAGDNMRSYLRVANVFEDRLDLTDVKTMNFTPEEFEKFRLRHGDVLLNEGQTPELVGRPAMFRGELEDCCYQKTLLRFRAYSGLLPEYALIVFRYYMHSGRFKQAASITTNIAHLTAEKFVEIEFPLPPVAEQLRIASEVERRLSVSDKVDALLAVNVRRGLRLRESILRDLFCQKATGELPL